MVSTENPAKPVLSVKTDPAKTMTSDAHMAAPADTPMMPGSASGLRNNPCMAAPHRASEAPTSILMHTLGKRMTQITASCCEVKFFESERPNLLKRMENNSEALTLTAPVAQL